LPVRSKQGKDILGIVLLLILVLLPLLIFYVIIHLSGPQWDMAVRILQGRTLLNFFTHGATLHTAFGGEAYPTANNLLYYFEPYREPLEIPIFAMLQIFFSETALPYVILIYALYILTLYKLGKNLKVERLVLFSVMVNSYIIYFLFIPNGGEALSVVLALLGFVYLLEEKASSGLLFGLASIAKYPSLCLFPLVLLLPSKKKIIQAILLELMVVVLWGVLIDYGLYGLPFYSYLESIGAANVASGPSSVAASALINVFAYPVLFLAIAGILLLAFKSKIKLKFDYRTKVLAGFAVLSLLCYLVILPHNDPFTQARYGYLSAVSLLVLTAIALTKASGINPNIKYAIAIFSVCLLVYALWLSYASNNNPGAAYYNYENSNGIYVHSEYDLASIGFGGCRFVSNAWIPMIYSGSNAYSPFVLYAGNGTVQIVQQTTAKFGGAVENLSLRMARGQLQVLNSSYREEEARYPIVVFNYTGVPPSLILNLNVSRLAYSSQNVSIYLPPNATCYR
jgi:hypothetical protein